jgi:hypothetical protein
MTSFWYGDLYHRWKEGPAAIAGQTAHGPLFCFEQLALQQKMRVVFRAEHAPAAGGVEHGLSGPAAMVDEARAAAVHRDWAERFADLVMRCPSGRSEIATACARGVAGAGSETLWSWVIAPAARA